MGLDMLDQEEPVFLVLGYQGPNKNPLGRLVILKLQPSICILLVRCMISW